MTALWKPTNELNKSFDIARFIIHVGVETQMVSKTFCELKSVIDLARLSGYSLLFNAICFFFFHEIKKIIQIKKIILYVNPNTSMLLMTKWSHQ